MIARPTYRPSPRAIRKAPAPLAWGWRDVVVAAVTLAAIVGWCAVAALLAG